MSKIPAVFSGFSVSQSTSITSSLKAEAGKGPDLALIPRWFSMDINKAVTSGIFCDLTKFTRKAPDYRSEEFNQEGL